MSVSALFVAAQSRGRVPSVLMPALAPLSRSLLASLRHSISLRYPPTDTSSSSCGGGELRQLQWQLLQQLASKHNQLLQLSLDHSVVKQDVRHVSKLVEAARAAAAAADGAGAEGQQLEQLSDRLRTARAAVEQGKRQIASLDNILVPLLAHLPNVLHPDTGSPAHQPPSLDHRPSRSADLQPVADQSSLRVCASPCGSIVDYGRIVAEHRGVPSSADTCVFSGVATAPLLTGECADGAATAVTAATAASGGGPDCDLYSVLGVDQNQVLVSAAGSLFLHGPLARLDLALQHCVSDWLTDTPPAAASSSPLSPSSQSHCDPRQLHSFSAGRVHSDGEEGADAAWSVRVSGPDTVKLFVVEACGGHPATPDFWRSAVSLQQVTSAASSSQISRTAGDSDANSCTARCPGDRSSGAVLQPWRLLLHHTQSESDMCLVGGASLPSLTASLARSTLDSDTIPHQLWTVGRQYHNTLTHSQQQQQAERAGGGSLLEKCVSALVNTTQTTTARCLSLSTCRTSCSRQFERQLRWLQLQYRALLAPPLAARWRWCSVAPPHLLASQSRRVELHLLLPALRRSVCAAYVAQLDDYVARRLHVLHGPLGEGAVHQRPIYMVDTCVMHVQRVLAAMLAESDDRQRVTVGALPLSLAKHM